MTPKSIKQVLLEADYFINLSEQEDEVPLTNPSDLMAHPSSPKWEDFKPNLGETNIDNFEIHQIKLKRAYDDWISALADFQMEIIRSHREGRLGNISQDDIRSGEAIQMSIKDLLAKTDAAGPIDAGVIDIDMTKALSQGQGLFDLGFNIDYSGPEPPPPSDVKWGFESGRSERNGF